jgi:outer membrane lipoprotein-sorting protein
MHSFCPAILIGAALIGSMGSAGADAVPRPASPIKSAQATEPSAQGGRAVPRPSVPVGTDSGARRPAVAGAARTLGNAAAATTSAIPAEPVLPAAVASPPAGAVAPPGGAIAFDAAQRSLIERANNYLTSVQTLSGDFVQVGPDGSRSEGKFYLQKPGRVRFEYDPPSPTEMICDGQSLVVRDRRLATQDFYPLSQTPIRFLLADRIDLLRDTNVVGVYADNLFATVVVEERHLIGGTHRLAMMFGAKDFKLRQWTITDPQGYDTTVALYNVSSGKRLDPELFRITYERMLQ